jgi:hypothetical protein
MDGWVLVGGWLDSCRTHSSWFGRQAHPGHQPHQLARALQWPSIHLPTVGPTSLSQHTSAHPEDNLHNVMTLMLPTGADHAAAPYLRL